MYKYKAFAITPPAGGEIVVTGLSIPKDKKAILKVLFSKGSTKSIISLIIENTTFVEVFDNMPVCQSPGVPLNREIVGPAEVDIKVTDRAGTGDEVDLILGYEEE